MSMKIFNWILLFFIINTVSLVGICSPDTLPAGINSPMFRYGVMQGLNQKFENDGQLWNLSELRSIEFDAQTLSKISPDAKTLITALDAFGQRHGQSINYGVLKFDIDPTVKYFAPVYAYGIRSDWTIAVALPIINYQNNISVQTVNSNLDSYKQVYFGRVSEDLDKALTLDIKQEMVKTLEQKGYKPLQTRNDQFSGDAQVVSIYKFYQSFPVDLFLTTNLSLPTGPQYDPDDLTALNIFGQTSIENTLSASFKGRFGFNLVPSIGYQHTFLDSITARVPLNEEDTLPSQNQKENVTRQTGGKINLKTELELIASDSIKLFTSYGQSQKSQDNFSGGNNLRYDLLSQNTQSREEKYSLGFSYNTIKSYFKKKALFPFIVGYEFSDVFNGENTNRKILNEFSFIMFF